MIIPPFFFSFLSDACVCVSVLKLCVSPLNLFKASLKCISQALSSCQSFSSLYIHHPALLHFICRYPLLEEKFGQLVLELWLTKGGQRTEAEQTTVRGEPFHVYLGLRE